MKGMPLAFDFEGKTGVLDNLELQVVGNKRFFPDTVPSTHLFKKNCNFSINHSNFGEPTSVLDSAKIPSRPTSSSTLSSSLGGGGGGGASTDTAGVAAVSETNPSPKWHHDSTTATSSNAAGRADLELLPIPPSLEIGTTAAASEKLAMEDWENVLSGSVDVSPSQEQTFIRWIMGDVEDPSMCSPNKALEIGGGNPAAPELEFSAAFASNVDQGFGPGECFVPNLPNFTGIYRSEKTGFASNPMSSNLKFSHNIMQNNPNNLEAHHLHHHQPAFDSPADMKPPIFNSQPLLNQHQSQQAQNPSFFFPLPNPHQQEQNIFGPPQPKRHNSGNGFVDGAFTNTDQQQPEHFLARQNLQPIPHQLQFLPHHYLPQRPAGLTAGPCPKIEELGQHSSHQIQQTIVDQIYKAAELVQTGNPVLAQGILARLNHQLSPIGKPFQRASFYFKEALQLLLNNINNNNSNPNSSPFSLVYKIGAYKSFSEISPLIQFTNFTSNQAILESIEGFDRVHIVDFDIGYGGQWASLMQELALKNGGPPSLKITVIVSPSTHDQLELGLARENLIQFAGETNIAFDFDVISVNSLNSGSWQSSHLENEAVVVNLPIGSLANYQLSPPFILGFVKHLSPRIVVSVDRGCDRTDLPFANHVIHALQSYSNLLESLDAVNVNTDALQKIEQFLLQPGIEKIVMGRFRAPEKTQHWTALFLSSGFTPVTFSNFTESQAECVIKRTPVRGFQVEKRQSSLVLCWQRKELISASAWRC
ncbi:hypothetical protein CASFOL_005846 [Castilleja foliolosa]|uniref:Scarecrow-like protein 6 n=1 Tax=Castilleja foliolosa TaxID=1961234 RepID=A0ABD3E500_9LAMI